jgi:hypothetical protein
MPIPNDLRLNLLSHNAPRSVYSVFDLMYEHSHYIFPTGYRCVHTRINDLADDLELSDRTVKRVLSYLRKHRYIRLIWRGFPHAKKLQYSESAYELPFNLAHVISWRIKAGEIVRQKGISPEKLSTFQERITSHLLSIGATKWPVL